MICTQCLFENPEGIKFCGSCGSPLNIACAGCGSINPAGFKFCGNCGKSLSSAQSGRPSMQELESVRVASKKEAERRHLTVMFCDVVGSTAMSERLDVEEFRRTMLDYQAVAEQVISHHGGHIAQYLGDGIMAYFGYPDALEDAPVIGVRCGLEMLEAVQLANHRWKAEGKPHVDIRIGVHTGLTVVDDYMAHGETCNVAARLQDLAGTNTMVISADALKLVKGWFVTKSIGEHQLKGLTKPIEVFEVNRESGARSRLDLSLSGDLTPLVGREREMSILLQCLEDVQRKKGSVVLLSGEAGIGKSRLIHDLKVKAAEDPKFWLVECMCSSHHRNSAFYPVIDLLENVSLKISRKTKTELKFARIEEFLSSLGFDLSENVPLLASLLSIPLSGSTYSSLEYSAEVQKHKIVQLLLQAIQKRAETYHVVLIFEDINWADPSTLELIDLVVQLPPSAGILTILTYRPPFTGQWDHTNLISVNLQNLSDGQTMNVVTEITGGRALPKEVTSQIVEKTDGIPLFVEELTRMVLESGLVHEEGDHYVLSGPLPPLAIPTTLQDSLKARLDRFSRTKEVVYWASTIGRDFSYELLEACCGIEPMLLQSYLRELVQSGLLVQKGYPPNSDYWFRHSLMQNAAYESILRNRRQALHQRIAMTLIEKFPETVATQPELPAHHFTEAGLLDQALSFWQQATEKAMKASAYVEAVHHIEKGLKLVGKMQDSDKRIQFELAFRVRNSTIIKIQDGWSSDKVKEAYDRCFELCKDLGESEELFTTLFGIWGYYLIGGNISQSYEIALECAGLTKKLNNPGITMQSHLIKGNSLFWLGRYDEANHEFEEIFHIYDEMTDHSVLVGFGQDTRIVTYMLWTWSLAMKGNLEQAYLNNQTSLELAAQVNHPFSEAIARCTACWFYQFTRDVEHTFQQAQFAIDLGFPSYQSWGYMLKGWAMAASGKTKQGIGEVKKGYQIFKDQGGGLETYPSVLLAEAFIMDGNYSQALLHVEKGLHAVESNKEMVFWPELLRLKAILHHKMHGEAGESEMDKLFLQAIEVGRAHSNALLSFRAALSWSLLAEKNGGVTPQINELLDGLKAGIGVKHFDRYLRRERKFA